MSKTEDGYYAIEAIGIRPPEKAKY
jgi:hypothetical protein